MSAVEKCVLKVTEGSTEKKATCLKHRMKNSLIEEKADSIYYAVHRNIPKKSSSIREKNSSCMSEANICRSMEKKKEDSICTSPKTSVGPGKKDDSTCSSQEKVRRSMKKKMTRYAPRKKVRRSMKKYRSHWA